MRRLVTQIVNYQIWTLKAPPEKKWRWGSCGGVRYQGTAVGERLMYVLAKQGKFVALPVGYVGIADKSNST